MEVLYLGLLVFHIIGVIIAVGSATLVDYLHLVALRKKRLEKGLVAMYPLISKMINGALVLLYITGIALLAQKPELLASNLFRVKMVLVAIVTINGLYLQKIVSPHLDKCVIKGTKYCTKKVLNSSAISGSISIVTWYSLVILSLTKTIGYSAIFVIKTYAITLAIAMLIAYFIESNARKWRG